MLNSSQISIVDYTSDLKNWLLKHNYTFFLVSVDDQRTLLTPFKDIIDLNKHKSKFEKSNFYQSIEVALIDNYNTFSNQKLNLSPQVIDKKNERSFMYLN